MATFSSNSTIGYLSTICLIVGSLKISSNDKASDKSAGKFKYLNNKDISLEADIDSKEKSKWKS